MAKMTQKKVARSDPHFPLPLSHPDLKSLGISITPRKLTLRQGARHLGAFGRLMSCMEEELYSEESEEGARPQ